MCISSIHFLREPLLQSHKLYKNIFLSKLKNKNSQSNGKDLGNRLLVTQVHKFTHAPPIYLCVVLFFPGMQITDGCVFCQPECLSAELLDSRAGTSRLCRDDQAYKADRAWGSQQPSDCDWWFLRGHAGNLDETEIPQPGLRV